MVLNKNCNIPYLYIIISMAVIAILTYLYITKKCSDSEPFCSCRNMINKICPDPKVLTNLYNTGKLTEFTDFAKIQSGKNNWRTTVMPEDEFAAMNYK